MNINDLDQTGQIKLVSVFTVYMDQMDTIVHPESVVNLILFHFFGASAVLRKNFQYLLNLCILCNFSLSFTVCRLFSTSTFSKNYFRNTIRVSNSLDPYQARHFVWLDLDPNCLQKLSADYTSRQRVKNEKAYKILFLLHLF